MSSKILYDIRDNKIKRSQVKPQGSAGLPSLKSLCKSARIPLDEIEFMNTCIIDEEYLTYNAQKELRIVDGKAIKKPKVVISTDRDEISLSTNPQFIINVELLNTVESDSFNLINMSINDAEFQINLADNTGSISVELSEIDTYVISCIEDRFTSTSVEVKAIA